MSTKILKNGACQKIDDNREIRSNHLHVMLRQREALAALSAWRGLFNLSLARSYAKHVPKESINLALVLMSALAASPGRSRVCSGVWNVRYVL